MRSATLVATPTCPVCGGAKREASDDMSRGGFHYLQHAAAPLGLTVDELTTRARAYRCLSCRSVYCDPWLSPELASSLYCDGAPDHNAGWSEVETWLRNLKGVGYGPRNRKLYAAVTRRTGPLRSYAEFGCPFQGFLLQMKAYQTNPATRIALFARVLQRKSDVRWTPLTRIYNTLEALSRRLFVLALRARSLLDAMTQRRETSRPSEVVSLPARRCLLTQDTTKGWGSNCVRYGASCQYFARTLLDADVMPIEEASRNQPLTFDLIGAFNSLDHTSFPLDVFRALVDMTDHVLVVNHRARLVGKQHLFGFGDDFGTWLAGAFGGLSVEDLRDELDLETRREYNCWLVTRRSGTTRGQGTLR